MAVEGPNPVRRSNRERVQTPKAAERPMTISKTQDPTDISEDEVDETNESLVTVPNAPKPKRTVTSLHLGDRMGGQRRRVQPLRT